MGGDAPYENDAQSNEIGWTSSDSRSFVRKERNVGRREMEGVSIKKIAQIKALTNRSGLGGGCGGKPSLKTEHASADIREKKKKKEGNKNRELESGRGKACPGCHTGFLIVQ